MTKKLSCVAIAMFFGSGCLVGEPDLTVEFAEATVNVSVTSDGAISAVLASAEGDGAELFWERGTEVAGLLVEEATIPIRATGLPFTLETAATLVYEAWVQGTSDTPYDAFCQWTVCCGWFYCFNNGYPQKIYACVVPDFNDEPGDICEDNPFD